MGPKKKNLNAYGRQMAGFVKKKVDSHNKQKIQAALEKVAGMPSDADNSASPTFGELLRQGKLPAGDTK